MAGGSCTPPGALHSLSLRSARVPNLKPSHPGADDRDRTGDLVLTKDVLCQLSYIGPPSPASRFAPGFGGASPFDHSAPRESHPRSSPSRAERRAGECGALGGAQGPPPSRRMERETGIEPATNSLEGCDSTTELLPPSLSVRSAPRFGGQARRAPPQHSIVTRRLNHHLLRRRLACLAEAASIASVWRRLVAREGFEPSKPLGRQIYSLLRLTASLPRRTLSTRIPCPTHPLEPQTRLR